MEAPTAASTEHSEAWFERACAVTPGGVNSPVRAFRAVGGTPRFFTSGRGAYVTDADGNDYVDLVCSWGPTILGHAHPEVRAAVEGAVARGMSFGAPSITEVQLAEEICSRVPEVEQVRLVSSGTEATMSAVRLARGFTGRPLIVKFAGCYHGHSDALLAAAGSGAATFGLPGSAGVTAGAAADTIVLDYNDPAALAAVFAEAGDRIAAIITEAAPANMGVVPPLDGFDRLLARTAHAHGALLISDEVMTGFRVSRAGWQGLTNPQGDEAPDLFTFGKVIGGGRGWPGVPYQIVIPGSPTIRDGRVVAYRVWDDDWWTWHTGAAWNRHGIGICVTGWYQSRHDLLAPQAVPSPDPLVMRAFERVARYLLGKHKLRAEESLLSHAECGKPACPGDALENLVRRMRGDPEIVVPGVGAQDPRPLKTIAQVQEALALLGYDPGKIDGVMGPRTAQALRLFQADAKVKPDAVFGPQTERALRLALAQRST